MSLRTFCIAGVFSLLISNCHAGVKFSIDADPNTPGVQDTGTATIGTPYTVDVVFEIKPGESVSSYGVSATFDQTILNLASLPSELVPPGFVANLSAGVTFPSNPTELATANTNGQVLTFDAFTTGLGPIGPSALLVAGSMTFNPIATGNALIDVGEFNATIDGIFTNALTVPFEKQFCGATITVVPEPSAFLMIAGVFGLALSSKKLASKFGKSNPV